MYDLPASQSGDLELREGDIVVLVKKVNDEWLEGRIGNCQGIFPINFIDIKIPLPGMSKNIVNALYAFKGETFEDLSFEVINPSYFYEFSITRCFNIININK